MTTQADTILQQALQLDAVERAELIEALFRSFDRGGDPRIETLWAEEAESRIDAYEQGKITADSASAVLRRIGQK